MRSSLPSPLTALQERLAVADIPARLRGMPMAAITLGFICVAAAGALSAFVPLDARWLWALLFTGGALALRLTRRVRRKEPAEALADRIDALLPQTQCGQCNYAGCRPYAEAIARFEADINQCPPGGEAGIRALAELLGREPKPLNPANGVEKPKAVAVIDEATCIGCTKCIQACPVDAILGASKLMHTVIADLCTGCELCLPPCPVDCIEMVMLEATPMRHETSR